MEISVGFTDKEENYFAQRGYICEESVLGKVYYPGEGIETEGQIAVRYMEYPWVSTFEVQGICVLSEKCKMDKE